MNDPWKHHRSNPPRPPAASGGPRAPEREPRGQARASGQPRQGGSQGGPRASESAWPKPQRQPPREPASEPVRGPARGEELRLYGHNAVRAAFERRPSALRKLYLAEAMIPRLQPLLKWCVAHRVGYRVVEPEDLDKLAGSQHHEGVVADVLRETPPPLEAWLQTLRPGPALLLWLDGVGNPHNFGAILRSAAHFGAAGILLPEQSPLALSGAAARVAEGGAESVPLVRLPKPARADELLHEAGFVLAATLVEGGDDVFATKLPSRLVYVIGAEGEGMDRALAQACDLRISIPGSGAVESLNVASATAVLMAQWRQRA